MLKNTTKFDWSVLDRYGIATYVWLLAPDIIGQKIKITDFHKKVTNFLKKEIPLKFKKVFLEKKYSNFVSVGGAYYSWYDQHKQKCIELEFFYNKSYKDICLSKKRFWEICLTIADTILHEVMHMRQYRSRKFAILPEYASTAGKTKVREEQIYLGCSDEIDAYGFNIACELYEKFNGDNTQIIKYLNENQKGLRRKANTWRMYLKAFQHNHNHIIIKRLKKKVIKYLPAAKNRKPYRNNEWINR